MSAPQVLALGICVSLLGCDSSPSAPNEAGADSRTRENTQAEASSPQLDARAPVACRDASNSCRPSDASIPAGDARTADREGGPVGAPLDAAVARPKDGSTPIVDANTDAGPHCVAGRELGSVDGVEPESVAHHPPVQDGNGNLYRFVESIKADGNQPRMMKSSDGGATWREVDEAGRPSASDLEGTYQLESSGALYVSVSTGDSVWWNQFNTSDANEKPDQWVASELVDDGLNATNMKQFSSLARTSDGRFWIFYSDSLVDERQQVAFRRRDTDGTYGESFELDLQTGSWSGPRAVVGSDDTTHILYKDDLNHHLLWRTLTPDGELSDAVRVDSGGTSSVVVPHTHPLLWEKDGQDVITVAFTGADHRLKVVTLTGGEVGEEVPLSSATLLEDADVVTNEGAVAHLASDGQRVHAVWTELETGNVQHRIRAADGKWGEEETLWASSGETALYVYCSVLSDQRCPRLGCTYDVGPHSDDRGDIRYFEYQLGPR